MAQGNQLALEPLREEETVQAERWPLLYSALLVLSSSALLWALIILAARALINLAWG